MWWLITVGLVLILTALYLLIVSYKKDTGALEDRNKALQTGKTSVNMNRWAARKEQKAAEARKNLNAELSLEATTQTILYKTEADVITAQNQLDETPARLERENELKKIAHEQTMVVTNKATVLEVDNLTYLEVRKKQLLDEQERLHQLHLAADEVRMTLIAKWLKDHQKLAEIQVLIDKALIEVAELQKGALNGVPIDSGVIPRMIASREESIAAWEENKRGVQQRLLQANDRQDVEGVESSSEDEGDT